MTDMKRKTSSLFEEEFETDFPYSKVKMDYLACLVIVFVSILEVIFTSDSLANQSLLRLHLSEKHLTCTLHLKHFSSDLRSNQLLLGFIEANTLYFIWTLWSPKVKIRVGPRYNFHEICSINVLVDGSLEHKGSIIEAQNYLMRNPFAQRSVDHSTFIVLRCKHPSVKTWNNSYQFPRRLYFYFVDCSESRGKLNLSVDRMMYENNLLRLDRLPDYYLWSYWSKRLPEFPNCLKSQWKQEDFRTQNARNCSVQDFFLQHLQERFNFSINPDRKIPASLLGRIITETRGDFMLHMPNHTSMAIYLFPINSRIIYCNIQSQPNVLTFHALWSPLHIEVWFMLILMMLLISITVSGVLKNAEEISKNMKCVASQLFIVYKILFGQALDHSRRNGLLMTFTLTSFLLVSIYEDDITSKLTVPAPAYVMKDLIELINEGYSVWYFFNEGQIAFSFKNASGEMFEFLTLKKQQRLFKKENYDMLPPWKSSAWHKHFQSDKGKEALFIPQDNRHEEMRMLKKHGNPKCNWRLITEPVSSSPIFALFMTHEAHKHMKLTQSFIETGMFPFWSLLQNLLIGDHLKNLDNKSSRPKNEFVYFTHLYPILIVWGSLMAVTFGVFVVEIRNIIATFLKKTIRNVCISLSNVWRHTIKYIPKFASQKYSIQVPRTVEYDGLHI
jgi:hypothetical protein